MKNKIFNLLLNLSIIIFITIKRAHSKNSESKNETTKYKNIIKNSNNNNNNRDDDFYMIFVNNTFNNDGLNNKREDINIFINKISNEINDIIIDNKKTYKDTTKLEKFEEKNKLLEKKNNFKKKRESDSKLAYPISSLNDKTIIYSYLSNNVVKIIEKLPYVMACVPDVKLKHASASVNIKKVKKETKWKKVNVRKNSDTHLSLISQGKFNDKLISQYDQNYYYPNSAGKDVDIFIIDNGFNFKHSEFANKDDRVTKCAFKVENAKVVVSDDDEFCEKSDSYHGEKIADVVGGLNHGVAPKANIYGIAMVDEGDEDVDTNVDPNMDDPSFCSDSVVILLSYFIAAMQHIRDSLFRPYKAIFNFSYGIALNYLKEKDKYIIDYWEEFINELVEEGAIFVASAGNENIQVDRNGKPFFYPCSYENVICVGAIDNYGKNPLNILKKKIDEINKQLNLKYSYELRNKENELHMQYLMLKDNLSAEFKNKTMNTENYEVTYFTNYGRKVDIHAPGYVRVSYQDKEGKSHTEVDAGTSYSSPIVVGVAATIMSENPKINFNSKTMLKYLNKVGIKNVINGIKEGNPNILINNGKQIVFSQDNIYFGCGPNNDNKSCSDGLVCSSEGYCISNNNIENS
ncbi:subtilisin-like protein [Piromyces finnis]|uniref:Subtilisin-like protein n=1 Tax=Piromyces finnis TaxID=1754191 RepID=A0A1Y1UWQ9_9FUNG|nr:subtilisin-like protein [Piromyces finnis]|eukprot:ORX42619.1 subtilisin-like protein [Piromyces finnis]